MFQRLCVIVALSVSMPVWADADTNAPWGSAKEVETQYAKQKVVYDTAVTTTEALTSVLDRASFLSALNGADPFDNKIVIVLHGNEIAFFATKNFAKYKALMTRAQSLTVGGNIEFRMCRVAAKSRGYAPKDIHGFVTMVPMGDAEIVRLQQDGYAYMR